MINAKERFESTEMLCHEMVQMSDGVRLATDIYFPPTWRAEPGQCFPVVLERTPYGKNVPSRSERSHVESEPLSRLEVARCFTLQGYVVVYQDCRGRYESEGEFVKYLNDAQDGYDTCAWIVAQPWSNGRIGMKGLSYAAHTQMAAASLGAPGLQAMVVDSGGFSNAFHSGVRQGGAYELKQAAWAVMFAAEHSRRAQREGVAMGAHELDQWFKRMPWHRGDSPLAATPDYEDFLFDQWERVNFDDYWKQPGLYAQGYYDVIQRAAAIHISSWYDVYSRTAIENHVGTILNSGVSKLVLGPWTHGNRWETFSGDVDFGEAARLQGNLAPSFMSLRVRWFDRWLKNAVNGAEQDPAAMIFVMGGGSGRKNREGRLDHGGCWREESVWPIARTRLTKFFLHEDGSLQEHCPANEGASMSYRFDPSDPVITLGGSVVSRPPAILAGGFDQVEQLRFFGCRMAGRALADRQDVLVFQTAHLLADIEVTGEIDVQLWISSDCPDTDFTAKLIDVYPPCSDYPDGYALNLTDSIMRVSHRKSWERRDLLQTGEICKINIRLFPVSNLFQRGHRIRLDISSSNFPKFDVNPNTGEEVTKATSQHVAHNTVHLSASHPSLITLPVIPRVY